MSTGVVNFCKTFSKVLSKFLNGIPNYFQTTFIQSKSNPKNRQFWRIKSITWKKAAINMQIWQTMVNTNFSYLVSKKLYSTFTVSKAGCFKSLKILNVLWPFKCVIYNKKESPKFLLEKYFGHHKQTWNVNRENKRQP